MTHVTGRLTAKNRDQLRNPIRSAIEYGLPLPFLVVTDRRLCPRCCQSYDARWYFNVRSKADMSQLNLPHGSFDDDDKVKGKGKLNLRKLNLPHNLFTYSLEL